MEDFLKFLLWIILIAIGLPLLYVAVVFLTPILYALIGYLFSNIIVLAIFVVLFILLIIKITE